MRGESRAPLSLEQIALGLSPFTAGVQVSSDAMEKIRRYIEVLYKRQYYELLCAVNLGRRFLSSRSRWVSLRSRRASRYRAMRWRRFAGISRYCIRDSTMSYYAR